MGEVSGEGRRHGGNGALGEDSGSLEAVRWKPGLGKRPSFLSLLGPRAFLRVERSQRRRSSGVVGGARRAQNAFPGKWQRGQWTLETVSQVGWQAMAI